MPQEVDLLPLSGSLGEEVGDELVELVLADALTEVGGHGGERGGDSLLDLGRGDALRLSLGVGQNEGVSFLRQQ